MRSLVQKFKQLMTSILYCYKLCWRASPLYTLFRLIGKFYQPIIGVVSAYLSKLMLDILASPSEGAFRDYTDWISSSKGCFIRGINAKRYYAETDRVKYDGEVT